MFTKSSEKRNLQYFQLNRFTGMEDVAKQENLLWTAKLVTL